MAIQLKRGLKANLPILKIAEPAWATDTGELFVGSASGNIKVFPIDGAENVDIVESSTNGNFIVNGNEINVFDDTEIINLLSNKATTSDITQLNSAISNKANNSDLTSLQTAVSNKADRSELPAPSSLETLSKLSDNGTTLLFNGSPIGGSGGSVAEAEFVTKDSWNTTGVHNLATEMSKIFINNTGNADLTFTINNITITVKSTEKYEDTFDPFTQVSITATGAFYAEASNLKVGSPNPLYSTKDSFSGSANTTRNFSNSMYGLAISNDGSSALTYTVNGITLSVSAGDVLEKYFDAFTQVVINSSVPFRGISKSGYVATNAGEDVTAPVITASPNGGSFNSNQSITLTSNENATIYYTTNGTTPTVASSVYSAPISITATTTLKFFGKDTIGNESSVQTIVFSIDKTAPTVTISPVAGTFSSVQTATLTANESATIYYTLDGTNPTTSSSVYSTPITINNTTTIKYFARDSVGNSGTVQTSTYTINLPDTTAPIVTVTPNGGTFTAVQNVSISTNESSTIYYTVDGSTPTESSSVYSSPINISSTSSLKVIAKDSSGNISTVQTVSFTINLPDVTNPNPVTALSAGTPTTNTIPVTWTLSTSNDVTAQEAAYSIDGSNFTVASASINPSSNSFTFTGLSANQLYTLRVIAIDGAGNRSVATTTTATTVAETDVTSPTITASPVAGTYASAQNITLTPSETATIYYTTDGTIPTISSSVYSTPIAISVPTIIKYFAKDTAGNQSSIYQERYIVGTVTDSTAPTLTVNPATGSYGTDQVLTATTNESSIIYYTTHATTPPTPTTASTKYTAPITVSSSLAYNFIAIDASGNQSASMSRAITIDKVAPVAPTNFIASAKRGTSMVLTWTASTSPDVNGYRIYDSTDFLLGTVTGTTFEVIGLTENTSYTFKLIAKDAASNVSTTVTVTDSTTTSSYAATGYVNDASLLLLTENPINLASVFNPNRFFNGNEKFTLSLTVNAPVLSTLMSRWVFGSNTNSRMDISKNASGMLTANLYATNTSNSSNQVPTVTSGVNLYTDNVLHHIVIVRDNPSFQIYVDDIKVGEGATQASDLMSVNNSTLPLFIGNAGKTFTFKNVAYYNRALSTSELTQNYNALK